MCVKDRCDSHTRRRALVVGWGNPHRCDDGAAYEVVAQLHKLLKGSSLERWDDWTLTSAGPRVCGETDGGTRVDYVLVHQLGPEMATLLDSYDVVVFVDARLGDGHPEVYIEPLNESLRDLRLSHWVGPGTVMAMAKFLYRRTPVAYTLSVAGYNFDFGISVSATVLASSAKAAELIAALVDRNGSEYGSAELHRDVSFSEAS